MRTSSLIRTIADLPLFPTKLGELFSNFLLSPIATNLVVPLLIALAAIILKSSLGLEACSRKTGWSVWNRASARV